jgi:hypothetical protein
MSPNDEDVLRRSLDAADRTRNRLLIGIAVAVLALIVALWHGAMAIESRSTMLFIHAVMLVLAVWTTILALVVIMQMNVMTKRILRAIELSRRS